MKKSTLLLILLITGMANAQTFSWADQFGGTQQETATMVTDASGNIYMTGSFEGTMDVDPGPGVYNLTSAGGSDIYIAKVNASGMLQWVKQIGSTGTDAGSSIAVAGSGNIYVTGTFRDVVDFDAGQGEFLMVPTDPYEGCNNSYDIFILKLTDSGDFAWAKQVGGNGYDHAYDIALGAGEEVFVSGRYASEGNIPVDLDPGVGTYFVTSIAGAAGFLLKLDLDGAFLWARQWYSTSISAGGCGLRDAAFHPVSLTVDGTGNVLCTGDFGSTVDFDPEAGVFSLGTLSNGAFIMKLTATGSLLWAREFETTGSHAYGKDVKVGSNGNVYSAGLFDGTIDFDPGTGTKNLKAPGGSPSSIGPPDAYVSILNASGNYVWAGQIGGSSDDAAYGLDLDGSGNIYVTGVFSGTADMNPSSVKNTLKSAGGLDVFICKLTGSGGYTWSGRVGGTLRENATTIDIDGAGSILVAGTFEGTADFNPGSANYPLTSFGGADAFVLKLSQAGPAINGDPEIATRSISPEIRVFPNPTTELLNVDFAQHTENALVQIYDLHGQLMLDKSQVTGSRVSVDISRMPAGTYLVYIRDEVRTVTLQFAKTE